MHSDVYKRPLLWVLVLVIFVIGFFHQPKPSKNDISSFNKSKNVQIVGKVESFPVSRKGTENIYLSVKSVNDKPTTGKVYARLKDFHPQWKDTLSFTASLQEPYGMDLVGNFNWKGYLALKGVFAEARGSEVTIIKQAPWYYRCIRAIRESILTVFNKSFSKDLASIAGGVLLGERGEISEKLYTDFQDSGAIHLLVASGGNVGFVVLIVLGLLSFTTLPRKHKIICSLIVSGIYTLIAGADVPLVRAYLMSVCSCAGFLLGRNSGVLQGLLLACLIIIGVQPASIFDVGFQMSFLATLSIIIVLNNYQPPQKWPWVCKFCSQVFLSTLACQLVLVPIFANVFYKVSLIGVISNLLLVPLSSVVMAISFAYYLLSVIHLSILFYPCLWVLELFKFLVEFFASFSFASIPLTAWQPGTILAYYSVLFVVFNLPNKDFCKKIYRHFLLAALIILVIQFLGNHNRVYVLNEWGKNAVIVQTANKQSFVFNGGVEGKKVQNALFKMGSKKAEGVFLFKKNTTKKDLTLSDVPTIIPLENINPNECLEYGKSNVCLKDAKNLTYCVNYKTHSVCVQEQGKKIVTNNTFTNAKFNATTKIKW